MATEDLLDLDALPADYVLTHAARLVPKRNSSAQYDIDDAGDRVVAQWGDGVDDVELAVQRRMSGRVANVRQYGPVGTADDTDTIQAAIDQVYAAGGGAVFFPRGRYVFTTLTLRTGVDLLGVAGSVLQVRDNVSDQNNNIAYYFLRANAQDNILIRGLTFDGNQANNRPVTEGASWVADLITITGDNIRIVDCTFVEVVDSAVMFAQCTNSLVADCRFDNAPDLGIYYNDTNGSVAQNNLIRGNRFTRCQYGAIGIKRHASGLAVVGNTARDCGNGITLEDFGSGSHPVRVLIADNRLEHIGHSYTSNVLVAAIGIAVNAAHGTTIVGNLIDDVVGVGIGLDGVDYCIVANNQVYATAASGGATNRGIQLNPRNSQGCRHNLITGNIVRGCQAEAFVALSGTGDHQYNRVAGNDFQSDASDGLRVNSNWLDNDTEGNRLSGETGSHFDLNINISSGTVVRNRWVENRLMNARRNGFVDVQTASIVADYGTRRVAVGTAAPTVGTWIAGDIVVNTAPGADTAMLWECTAGGTPGTWLGKKGVPLSGTLTMLGNLAMATAGLLVDFDASSSGGNIGCRWNKADANNLTWASWRNGGVDQWLGQMDTSENWNLLDSAAAVALQLQRTGGYVRAANGFRVGGTGGPLQLQGTGTPEAAVTAPVGSTFQRTDGGAGTSFYVKESGSGNTGWIGK